jgi:spermidine synthase
MEPSVRRVAFLLFGSGFAALVYQTAWQRLFQLTFGASTAASAAVLAIFLGGLGVGGLLLGRRVERSNSPLRWYADLEIGIALWAALTPFLRSGVHHLYLALGGTETLGTTGATVVRLAFAALVIGPASVLMGGTLPAAARAVVADSDDSRRGLALLYALNTVGAVVGALVGPVLLFGIFGTELTLWAAVCVNLLVGVFARAMARSSPAVAVSTWARPQGPGEAHVPSALPPKRVVVFAYLTAAVAGLGFLSLELVWFRILSPILGGSSITFGLILATALLGIGVGGFFYSLRSSHKPATVELLATTLAAEALLVILPFAWGDDLALVAAHLREMINLGFGYLLGGWMFVALVVVFPASVVSGYQFPALFALLGRGRAGIGRHVGEAYAWNTLGTLAGSLLTGFVLLPTLGAVGTWRVVAVLYALLAIAGAGVAYKSTKQVGRTVLPLATALGALLFCTGSGPGPVFRHSPVGAGRLDLAELTPNEVISIRREASETVIWERDGVESSVAIDVVNGIAFLVNGKSDGAVVDDANTQAFLGLIPAALHPNPKRAFVVGLGTGMTAGVLGRTRGMERVDVAELERSVLEVAHRSALANDDVLRNRRVNVHIGDGRELLLTTERTYDVIVSEPSNPYRAGVASLFTREFYQAGAARLAPGGLFAQWLQSYEIDGTTASMALRTLGSVFPYVSVWSPGGSDLVLVGSASPQRVDMNRLRRVVAEPHYLDWMRRAWRVEGAEAFVAHHIASPPMVTSLVELVRTPINTDDLNLLEVSFGRLVGDGAYSAIGDFFATLDVAARRPEVTGSIDWTLVEERRHRVDWSEYTGPPATPRTQATNAGCEGSMTRAGQIWPYGEEPADVVETWVVGYTDAIRNADVALERASALEKAGFEAEALMVRSRLAEAKTDLEGATRLLVEVFDQLRKKALPLCDVPTRALNRARSIALTYPPGGRALLRALSSGPFAVHHADGYRRTTRETIGAKTRDPGLCMEAFAARHGPITWALEPLAARTRCFERAKSPDAKHAHDELALFLSNEPRSFKNPKELGEDPQVLGVED